ncbi:hypothetical protein MHB42_19325 [Lysinibacillus sp. FSL K6-0232]|uniref:hypothetical protein n=1 Tax=unclassified Lysinibacillus TaxID=2636778 RepID=UPI0030FC2BAA
MKIEVGESLMLSWLRHVKKCQSVQLNWKPSVNHWELSNDEEIEQILQTVNAYFEDKYSFNIFKNNKSYMQLLQQGELDALGLQIKNGNVQEIYGVDVAFHEAGLNYGSKIETIERIIKKVVRTSMLLYGYFNMKSGTIIFASPKINNAIYEPLQIYVKELEELFRSMELDFEIELLANENFKNQVLDPVLQTSSSVADTSELFLRSIQMYNMFLDTNVISMTENKIPIRNQATANIAGIKEISIADFVRNTFSDLVDQNKLSKDNLYHLCDARYSKETFLLPYAMLKKVDEAKSLSSQRKDENGRDRYLAKPLYVVHGERYFLCNHWVEKSRQPYKVWFENLIEK